MTEDVKRRWKFPEEPPRWFKWLGALGVAIYWAVKMAKELGRP